MAAIQIVYIVATLVVFAFTVVSIIYGIYAVYYAYFKAKDERQKHIVLRSTANAFAVLLAYFVLEAVVAFAHTPWLSWLWQLLHFGQDGAVVGGMLAVLGVCLFINKRRAGGD